MLRLGSGEIGKVMLGSTEINKIYLGTTEIYSPGGEPQTYDARIAANDDDGTEREFPFISRHTWSAGGDDDGGD